MAEVDAINDRDLNGPDDKDSALGSDISTYTETLRSSIRESVNENGRSYHKYHDGSYILPEDEQEQERLDVQHEMFMRTFNRKLVLAPIDKDMAGNVRELLRYLLQTTVVESWLHSRSRNWHWPLGHSICGRAP
jgi:hypothetical protein